MGFVMVGCFAEVMSDERLTPAGGKGQVLAKLYQAGYPVPDGLVLFPAAFIGDGLRPEAWAVARQYLAQWRGSAPSCRFAVRSSAMGEDSAQASFAGAFESVLDVDTDEEVEQAIQLVRRSRQQERVQAYSQAQKLTAVSEMAVIIQIMVPAQMAGVLFTADPVTGSHSAMTGNFVYGLGDKLVSGVAAAEMFQLEQPSGSYTGPVALKRYSRRLFKLAIRLAQELGSPQDIEWAVAGGRVYILQARPITTLQTVNPATGERNDSLGGDYLWTNTNLGEALPDVMTPLTWSVFQIYFEETFPLQLPGNHPLGGNIGGRLYLNLSVPASIFASLGMNVRKALVQNAETFGTVPANTDIPLIPLSRRTVVQLLLPAIWHMRRQNRRNRQLLPDFVRAAPEQIAVIRAQIAAATTPAQLHQVSAALLEPFMRQGSRMIQAAISQLEEQTARLRRDLTALVGDEEAGVLLGHVSGDGDDLMSLGPLLGLAQLAAGEIGRDAYVQAYGHRGPQEAELAQPRPVEDPHWIEAQLAQMSEQDIHRARTMLADQRVRYAAAWANVQLRFPRQADKLAQQLEEMTALSRLREAVRSEITRGLWAVRELALRAGEFTGIGDDVFFLSWAEVNEVLVGEETAVSTSSVQAVSHIPARRHTYETYRALPPYPPLIRGRFDPCQWATDPGRRPDYFDARHPYLEADAADGVIRGLPGAPGVVEGVVRRLDSPDEGGSLRPGEILVTATTNIGWTPLFLRAAAMVTDVGAPLSHAAIVARELGVTAVVGCGSATSRLRTGDRVRVNGSQGFVEVL